MAGAAPPVPRREHIRNAGGLPIIVFAATQVIQPIGQNLASSAESDGASAMIHIKASAGDCPQGQQGSTSTMDSASRRDPHEKYHRLIAAAQEAGAIASAVVHPCDGVSLEGAVKAHELGLIDPILVGPSARIREAAAKAGLDITPFPLIDSAHSHESAQKGVELVRAGRAESLMKGSLHTDELMAAVVAKDGGIRTERRISHCFIMDVPKHP
jgi:hypothetical protein